MSLSSNCIPLDQLERWLRFTLKSNKNHSKASKINWPTLCFDVNNSVKSREFKQFWRIFSLWMSFRRFKDFYRLAKEDLDALSPVAWSLEFSALRLKWMLSSSKMITLLNLLHHLMKLSDSGKILRFYLFKHFVMVNHSTIQSIAWAWIFLWKMSGNSLGRKSTFQWKFQLKNDFMP